MNIEVGNYLSWLLVVTAHNANCRDENGGWELVTAFIGLLLS